MWGDGCSVSKIPYGFLDLSALFNFKYIFKSRFCFLHPNGTFCFLVVFEDWLQNTKPPSMSSKKGEGLWVFCGGGGEWVVVSSSCDSERLSVLLFCTYIVLVGNTRSVCCTARQGLHQMMAVEAHQTAVHRLWVSSRAWSVPSSLWYKAASAQGCFPCHSSES